MIDSSIHLIRIIESIRPSTFEHPMDTMNKADLPLDSRDPPPSGYQRSPETQDIDHHLNHHSHSSFMSMKPRPPPMYHSRGGYPYHGSHYQSSTRSQHPIQSVVTTSFEERDDGCGRLGHRHFPHHQQHHHAPPDYHRMEGRQFEGRSPTHGGDSAGKHNAFEPPLSGGREESHYGRDLPPIQENNMDMRNPPHEVIVSRTMRVPPSPREQPPSLHDAYSGDGPMKRSFWHHAKSGDEYQNSLPNEFMPPKRSKVGANGRRDYIVTARTPSEDNMHSGPQAGWFNRATSWEAREEYYHRKSGSGEMFPSVGSWGRSPTYREGGPAPHHWTDAPPMPSPRMRYSPGEGGGYDIAGQPSSWSPRWLQQDDSRWGGPHHRDDIESMHFSPESQQREPYEHFRRQGTFESRSDSEPPMRFINGPPIPTHAGMDHVSSAQLSHRVMPPPKGPESTYENIHAIHGNSKNGPIRILALPEDRISLSETLCLVRENIEVFTATVEDVEAPAPGRKHAVVVGQVGLRCIHCRHTTRSSERVKRAVCYPSSIKRIYRTVIDMKLDHFSQCKFVPTSLKDTLNALKANNTRSTGTTMQYFIKAAGSLGMVDSPPSGVRLVETAPEVSPLVGSSMVAGSTNQFSAPSPKTAEMNSSPPILCNTSNASEGSLGSSSVLNEENIPKEVFTGKVTLSLPEDKMSLSPLRCFLREQVCAFSATEEDIAVRTPTTFSVAVGQVGIACIHCFDQPAKSRLNRAVCFPFSIGRIYQSVADIQRFHLGECPKVPEDVKAKFVELQNASSKGSKGLATRQFWVSSAKKIGLADTTKGIRFSRDPSEPESMAVSLDILAQVASHVTTVNRPLVLPEDKPLIADFLCAVMEQMQACKFTEADRNKRRLKDVGCFGVECKHCAGKVDSRKFFWSSVNAVESNFVSVHTHLMECKYIPEELKKNLSELKKLRKEQTTALKTGSQKAFFSRVWERLHCDDKEQREKAAAKEANQGETEGKSSEHDTHRGPQEDKLLKSNGSVASLNEGSFALSAPNSPAPNTLRMSQTMESELVVSPIGMTGLSPVSSPTKMETEDEQQEQEHQELSQQQKQQQQISEPEEAPFSPSTENLQKTFEGVQVSAV